MCFLLSGGGRFFDAHVLWRSFEISPKNIMCSPWEWFILSTISSSTTHFVDKYILSTLTSSTSTFRRQIQFVDTNFVDGYDSSTHISSAGTIRRHTFCRQVRFVDTRFVDRYDSSTFVIIALTANLIWEWLFYLQPTKILPDFFDKLLLLYY